MLLTRSVLRTSAVELNCRKKQLSLSTLCRDMREMMADVRCKLTGIEMGQRLIPIAFTELKPQSREKQQTSQSEKKVASTLKFLSERRLRFEAYEVRLMLSVHGITRRVS